MTDMKEDLSILALTMAERDRFRDALIEIQKVAEISEGENGKVFFQSIRW